MSNTIGQVVDGHCAYDEDGDCLIVAETREEVANWLDKAGYFAEVRYRALVWAEMPLSGEVRLVPLDSPAGQKAAQI